MFVRLTLGLVAEVSVPEAARKSVMPWKVTAVLKVVAPLKVEPPVMISVPVTPKLPLIVVV